MQTCKCQASGDDSSSGSSGSGGSAAMLERTLGGSGSGASTAGPHQLFAVQNGCDQRAFGVANGVRLVHWIFLGIFIVAGFRILPPLLCGRTRGLISQGQWARRQARRQRRESTEEPASTRATDDVHVDAAEAGTSTAGARATEVPTPRGSIALITQAIRKGQGKASVAVTDAVTRMIPGPHKWASEPSRHRVHHLSLSPGF
jgi:hypothetical protein